MRYVKKQNKLNSYPDEAIYYEDGFICIAEEEIIRINILNIKKIKEGLGNNQWQYIEFRNRLVLVNGQDKPQTFYIDADGKDCWNDASFEGDNLHAEKLINIAVCKQRLFFVEKGT